MTMKWINEMICEELDGAKCYIHKAIYFKEAKEVKLASMFYNMATQEMEHAQNFREMAKELFEKGESEYSKDVWEYMRDKAMKKKEKVQYYMAVYKM